MNPFFRRGGKHLVKHSYPSPEENLRVMMSRVGVYLKKGHELDIYMCKHDFNLTFSVGTVSLGLRPLDLAQASLPAGRRAKNGVLLFAVPRYGFSKRDARTIFSQTFHGFSWTNSLTPYRTIP
jgi:hypothetical protein